MEVVYQQLYGFISENKLDPALQKIESIFSLSNSDLLNDVILIKNQYRKLRSEVRKGIIDSANENLRHARIANSILELIGEIKNSPEAFSPYFAVEARLEQATQARNLVLPIQVKDALFARLAQVKERGASFRTLWIDETPGNNKYETKILQEIGIEVAVAQSSEAALRQLQDKNSQYDWILSNIGREGNDTEGLDFHRKLIDQGVDLPMVFYVSRVDRSKGVPPYAFGIADTPNDLLHLVVDVVQRK